MRDDFLQHMRFDSLQESARAILLAGLLDRLIFKERIEPETFIKAGFGMRQLLPGCGPFLLRTERLNVLFRGLENSDGSAKSPRPDACLARLRRWLAHWSSLITHGSILYIDDTNDKAKLVPAPMLMELLSYLPEVHSLARIVKRKTHSQPKDRLSPRTARIVARPPHNIPARMPGEKLGRILVVQALEQDHHPLLSILEDAVDEPAIAAVFLIHASRFNRMTSQLAEAVMEKLTMGFLAVVHLASDAEIADWHARYLLEQPEPAELAELIYKRHRALPPKPAKPANIDFLVDNREPLILLQRDFSQAYVIDPRATIDKLLKLMMAPYIDSAARALDAAAKPPALALQLKQLAAIRDELNRRSVQVAIRDLAGGQARSALYPDSDYAVDVFIAPLTAVRATFADWHRSYSNGSNKLDVTLTPLYMTDGLRHAAGQTGAIALPQFGGSAPHTFSLRTPAALRQFRARIVVSHRTAVLQTLILTLEPITGDPRLGIPYRLAVESNLTRPDDVARRDDARYDLTLILNHDFHEQNGVTVTDRQGTFFTEPEGWSQFKSDTQLLLSEQTLAETLPGSLEDPVLVNRLRGLAYAGVSALKHLRRQAPHFHSESARYIQVIEAVNGAFLPVELFYDGDAPAGDARICRKAAAALAAGACDHSCRQQDRTTVICPLAFWGMSKFIERKKNTRGNARAEIIVPRFRARHKIAFGPPMLGVSSQVDAGDYGRLRDALKKSFAHVLLAANWDEWVVSVRDHKPPLHVLLPHMDSHHSAPGQLALEIHDSFLLHAQVHAGHLCVAGDSPPVVLMIGCETGSSSTHPLMNFASEFYALGARMVLATQADVLGRHASVLAGELTSKIAAAKAPSPNDFASVLITIKREMFAKSNILGLALIAYGDTTWELDRDN